MTSLTVLFPNARRCNIKLIPSTLLQKVLEDACLQQGYEPATHELRHQRRVLDAALPFRLAGLPNNVTVELHPRSAATAESVTIALQIESGRPVVSLPPSSSLFELIEKASIVSGSDLTSSTEAGVPSCSYMNRQYRGEAELRATTLQSIGITTGRSLIRYQRLAVNEARLREIESKVEEEKQKREELDRQFNEKKAQNAEAERIEQERLKAFEVELRQKEAERLLAEQEEERKREQQAREATAIATTVAPANAPLLPSSLIPDRLPSPPASHANSWSFDQQPFLRAAANRAVTTGNHAPAARPVTPPQSSNRLNALQAMIAHVNTSLSNRDMSAAAELVAERGRLPIGEIAAALSTSNSSTASEQCSTETALAELLPTHCDRQAVVFTRSPPEQVAGNGEPIDDAFFELTVDDAKKMQQELRQEARAQTQRALMPRTAVQERNAALKLKAYQHTVLLFVLPNNQFVQATFLSREPVSHIFDFVRELLPEGSVFSLHFLREKLKEKEQQNLVAADLAPSAKIVVKVANSEEKDESVLKAAAPVREATAEEAERISREWLSVNTVYKPFAPVVAGEANGAGVKRPTPGGGSGGVATSDGHSGGGTPAKMAGSAPLPKWLGKKK